MHYVYILKSLIKEKFYTGCTNNLEKRMKEHNEGLCYWTKRHIPWEVHYLEDFKSKKDAFKREKYLKSHAGKVWIKKYLGD